MLEIQSNRLKMMRRQSTGWSHISLYRFFSIICFQMFSHVFVCTQFRFLWFIEAPIASQSLKWKREKENMFWFSWNMFVISYDLKWLYVVGVYTTIIWDEWAVCMTLRWRQLYNVHINTTERPLSGGRVHDPTHSFTRTIYNICSMFIGKEVKNVWRWLSRRGETLFTQQR